MLSKVSVSNIIPEVNICNDIKCVLKIEFIENSTYYTNNDGIVINNRSNYTYKIIDNKVYKLNKISRIPIFICDIIIWKSIDVFDQNNVLIANKIRKYVCNILKNTSNDEILGIGGEFQVYFVLLRNKYKNFHGISNNYNIIDDAVFNCELYRLEYDIKYVNYNMIDNMVAERNDIDVIVNLSKVTKSVVKYLNNNENIKNLIIIGCHNQELDLMKKYKLKNFRYFKNFENNVKVYYFQNKNSQVI